MDLSNTTFDFKGKYKIVFSLFIVVGVVAIILGLMKYEPEKIWSAIILNNIQFLAIALGGILFISFHIIGEAGWHSAIQRVPEAISMFLPVAAVLMLVSLLGLDHVYHWIHELHSDPIIAAKEPYLNVPFFITRLVVYLAIWITLTIAIRKLSIKSDIDGNKSIFSKSRLYAALFVVFFALSIVSFAWDWLMSIEAHWFSTMFGWYVLAGVLAKGVAAISIVVFVLRSLGYLQFLRTEHIHDLARYQFSFAVFWMYLWFSQFMLIWYSNIPEETVYFVKRLEEYKLMFFLNIGLNFLVPFAMLLSRKMRRNLWAIFIVAIIVFVGQWVDKYMMIFPGTLHHKSHIGFFDIGLTIGYIGLFFWVVFKALSKTGLIPKNHPYLIESFNYENI